MIFTIKCDDYVLHDSRNRTLFVTQPQLALELNKNGSLTFTIHENHPYYNNLVKLKSIITVYQDNGIIFKGRILDDTVDIYKSKKVTVEGIRAYLLDSIFRPFEFQGDIPEFFNQIIDNHNSQVESFQRFTVGNITVSDPNNYINRSSIEYLDTLEVINSRLIKTHGGYLVVRYGENTNYLDYLSDFSGTSTQTIEFAKNITDFTQKVNGSEIITGIIPLGEKLKDEDGNEIDKRLTIESVNDGKDYLLKADLVSRYGKIMKIVEWDDVSLASNLKTKGQAYLNEHTSFIVDIDISAVDLSATSTDINYFKVGQYVIVKSAPHGINETYLLKKMTIDISNPSNTKIQLGGTTNSLTDVTVAQTHMTNDIVGRIGSIETHYVPNEQVNGIINETVELNSFVNQLPEIIMSRVEEEYTKETDFEYYQNLISTQMEQSSSEITLQFQNITSLINKLDDDTTQQFSDIVKYIRFVDGSIILGQRNNPFIVKISNNRISFLENETEVAYMNNNRLYITNGEFIDTLQLGNFTFSPRTSGNLSFFKDKG